MQPDAISNAQNRPPMEQALSGWRQSVLLKILLAVIFVFGIAALYPFGGASSVVVPEGSVWNGPDVIADFSFPVERPEPAYNREKDSASASVLPLFEVDAGAKDASIRTVMLVCQSGLLDPELTIEVKGRPHLDSALLSALTEARATHPARKEIEELGARTRAYLLEAYRRGVIDIPRADLRGASLAVRHEHAEWVKSLDSVADVAELATRLHVELGGAGVTLPLQELAAQAVRAGCRANLIFDSVNTAREHRAAIAGVPRTDGIVARGERILARGERVDASALARFKAYQSARTLRGEKHVVLRYLGAAMQLSLILVLVVFYLITLRKKLLADNLQLLLFVLIVVVEAVLGYLSMLIGGGLPMEYLIVIPTAAMLGTILFDSRTGFFFAVVTSLIVAGIRGNDYNVALGALVAGGLAAYTVRDIRSRTQLFKSMGYIFTGYALTIAAAALVQAPPSVRIMQEAGFALLNAVFSPVLTYGVLLAFERLFNLTSDLTLLEFDNINHPLLKELSTSAPGTFHHTMVIADMAERAANAIGAHATLAKVGAYYHDVGKIQKPDLFVENQLGIRNKHERMTPLQSVQIIMQHVPDGLALAAAHKLPQKIADFIPMHHGTTTVAYFYDRALRRRRREDVKLSDFQYPGPKPRSKETAIVMLADSVEATFRSLQPIDEKTIEQIVDRTIRNRFLEGQLDECDLTAADLISVRDQFVEILIGIHHPRIKYPDQQHPQTDTPRVPIDELPTLPDSMPAEGPQDIPPPTEMPADQIEPHEDPL